MNAFILDLDQPSPVKAARAATVLVDRPVADARYLLARTEHRDVNAALNITARGHARLAGGIPVL